MFLKYLYRRQARWYFLLSSFCLKLWFFTPLMHVCKDSISSPPHIPLDLLFSSKHTCTFRSPAIDISPQSLHFSYEVNFLCFSSHMQTFPVEKVQEKSSSTKSRGFETLCTKSLINAAVLSSCFSICLWPFSSHCFWKQLLAHKSVARCKPSLSTLGANCQHRKHPYSLHNPISHQLAAL